MYISNKVETVLRITGLKNEFLEKQSSIEQALDSNIDYKTVNEKISKLILESKNYLKEAIAD